MVRSGSPRPLSKPRNTFALYSTPLSRAVRPICSIRRLARRSLHGIDLNDVRTRWEKHVTEKPTEDVRFTCGKLRGLYKKGNELHRMARLNDLFPTSNDVKTFEECVPFEEKISDENQSDLPIRYPKLLEDSSEFFTQFTHHYTSILKKRPYESNESSNEGNLFECEKRNKFLFWFDLRQVHHLNER